MKSKWTPSSYPVVFSTPQVAAGTAKSWVAKGDADRFSVRKLGLFTNTVWASYNGDISIYGIYWYRNTTNELMSWLTRLGIQAIWVWVKMGAIFFKLQDLPKLYWRANRSSFVVLVSPHFRSTRAPQICEVEAMLFCLCLKTRLPVKLMACLVRLCIAYLSR